MEPGSVVPSNWQRQWAQTDAQKFCLNMRKNFFTVVRVTMPWDRLCIGVVESPSLEIPKN